MGRYVFKLPDVGEGTAEAEIVAWHVKVGDVVQEDQNLVDVMTDKATVEMTAPVAGAAHRVRVGVWWWGWGGGWGGGGAGARHPAAPPAGGGGGGGGGGRG